MTDEMDKTKIDEAMAGTQEPGPASVENETLESLRAERDKYLELAKRTRADFENYQKRAARDLQTERRYAAVPLVTDLLPVLENLDRAMSSVKIEGEPTGLVAGIQMVQRQAKEAFSKHGIDILDPVGEMFDPNAHEAVMQEATADRPPMTVLHTVRVGCKYHDRIIRPAQVILAKAP